MSTDPRIAAVRNLQQVLAGRSLDAALASSPDQPDSRQWALTAELSFGVCRWYRRLDHLVGRYLKKPLRDKDQDIHLLLLIGAYQLLYSRVPPHAAISTVVDATRKLRKQWAGGLVNGVLRALQRDPPASPDKESPGIRFAQPDWFVAAVGSAWPDDVVTVLDALQQRAPMTIRVNLARVRLADYAARLQNAGITARPLAAVSSALQLDRPVAVDTLPGFAEGLVSVQDAAAQLAGHLLDVHAGQAVLDACAAPGGKTGHLLEQADDLALTAIDIDQERLGRVRENLDRLGFQATLLAADAADEAALAGQFDRILVDAPCSATGVIRRHPDIRLLRRATDIEALAARQSSILHNLWSRLRPGGKLLYATCSILPQENHQQIERFMQSHADSRALELPDGWGRPMTVGRQVLPGENGMDGFYYALLQKDAG